jgi:hypothetical protein
MRKITYLLCLFILTGCSKKSVSPTTTQTNATMTYSFSANVSGTYSLTYLDPLSLVDSAIQFTGTTWSKNYMIQNAGTYINDKVLPLEIYSTAELSDQILALGITVNNEVKATGSSTSVQPNISASYDFQTN